MDKQVLPPRAKPLLHVRQLPVELQLAQFEAVLTEVQHLLRQLDEAHALLALHVAPAEDSNDATQVLPLALMANPSPQPLHCPDVPQELQFAGIDEEEQQLPVRHLPEEH